MVDLINILSISIFFAYYLTIGVTAESSQNPALMRRQETPGGYGKARTPCEAAPSFIRERKEEQ
jgi:hypothetical protein